MAVKMFSRRSTISIMLVALLVIGLSPGPSDGAALRKAKAGAKTDTKVETPNTVPTKADETSIGVVQGQKKKNIEETDAKTDTPLPKEEETSTGNPEERKGLKWKTVEETVPRATAKIVEKLIDLISEVNVFLFILATAIGLIALFFLIRFFIKRRKSRGRDSTSVTEVTDIQPTIATN